MIYRLAELSSSAGPVNDGVVTGSIAQSLLSAVRTNVLLATTMYVLRKDNTASGANVYTDITADAISNVADQCLPWGTTADMSANDETWIAADRSVCELYVHITTPGVWAGSGLKIYESLDGSTLQEVGNLSDGSNGLRNAGVSRITFTVGNRAEISPTFGATKRKYIVLKPDGLTAVTTAPRLQRIFSICDSAEATWSNAPEAALNGAFDSSNFTGAQDTLLWFVGAQTYFGLPGLSIGLDDAIYRAHPNVRSGVYEYLANDNTWKTLTGITDPGNQLRNGPATFGDPVQKFSLRWVVPTDWSSKPLTFPPETAPVSAYWMRFRATAITQYGYATAPRFRRRAKSFGAGLATGDYLGSARTFTGLGFRVNGAVQTSDIMVSVGDSLTGDTRTVTIPANTRHSGDLADGRLAFGTALSFPSAGQLFGQVAGSGRATDVELWLVEG